MVDKHLQRSAGVLSTLFAILFLGLLSGLAQYKLRFWHTLPAGEKFWAVIASAYAMSLVLSGVIYAIFRWRIVGLLHGMLMLSVAGLMLYAVLFSYSRPQAGDPAAGIVAGANVVLIAVCLVVGVVAALCGVGVLYSALPQAHKGGAGG